MALSIKSKYLVQIILIIIISALAYGIGTLRGLSYGQEIAMVNENTFGVMTTLNFLEAYHSENNKRLEQMLDQHLHTYTKALLSLAKYENYKKKPLVIKTIFRNIGPETQKIQDVINKQLTGVSEYRKENPSLWLAGSEEMYESLMTYLPNDSQNSTKN